MTINRLKKTPEKVSYQFMPSPVGKLAIVTSAKGLHAILWESDFNDPDIADSFSTIPLTKDCAVFSETKAQLAEYFLGKRKTFDLPLVLEGTAFQLKAWEQLQKIPYGKTITYAEQAAKLGNRNKARAIGMANHVNPISIVVPCHRVIGTNGKLTGFAAGLECKSYLLRLEKQNEHQPAG